MKRYFDTVIIGLGLFFLGFGCFLVWERNAPKALAVALPPEGSIVKSAPTILRVDSLGLELQVIPARIVDQNWQITKDGVSYLTTSPLPGEQGNSVMYGHNWPAILGGLKHIKVGDQIQVQMSSGQHLTYTVHFVSVVTSDQTHIYANTTDYRLTLYTCTGFLDTKRLVVTAILDA